MLQLNKKKEALKQQKKFQLQQIFLLIYKIFFGNAIHTQVNSEHFPGNLSLCLEMLVIIKK